MLEIAGHVGPGGGGGQELTAQQTAQHLPSSNFPVTSLFTR